MNDVPEQPVQSHPPPGLDGVTAGALLRAARESAGLHIAALAVSLKVPVKKLEALEADRIDALPDAVFARALAASVCRVLKVDPSEVLQRLPQSVAPNLASRQAGINEPFKEGSGSSVPLLLDRLTKPVVGAVAALLLGALVLALWPSVSSNLPTAFSSLTAAPTVASSTDSAISGASATPGTAINTSSPLQVGTLQSTPELSQEGVPAAGVAAKSESESATGPVASKGLLVVKTKGDAWVEVLDAKGVVLLRRNLAPAESVGATGELPLRVTVGRADTTEIFLRGNLFDMTPYIRDNVARFEVK